MPQDPDQAVAAMRGQHIAWALTNVPGMIPDNLVRSVVTFTQATGHAHKPVDLIARYVEAGVATFFQPMGAVA